MRNQVILTFEQTYPFGGFQLPQRQNRQILVLKRMVTGNKQIVLSHLKHYKSLKIPHTIQILSILQNQSQIQLYYEYVPLKYQKWMKNLSDQFEKNIQEELLLIAKQMAENRIFIQFDANNIGLNEDFHIKYFVDYININNNNTLKQFTVQQLKFKYYHQIIQMLQSIHINVKHQKHQQIMNIKTTTINPSIQAKIIKSPSNHYKIKQFQRKSLKIIQRNSPKQHFHNFSQISTLNKQKFCTQGCQIQKQSTLSPTRSSIIKQSSKTGLLNKLNDVKYKLKLIKLNKINNKLKQNDKLSSVKSAEFKNLKDKFDQYDQNRDDQEYFINNNIQKNNSNLLQHNSRKTSASRNPNQVKSSNQIFHNKLFYRKSINQSQISNKINSNFSSLYFSNYNNPPLTKRIKSQKTRTPKNSQSPIQYHTEYLKSIENYAKIFLDVLEDEEEDGGEDIHNNRQEKQIQQQNQQCIKFKGQKCSIQRMYKQKSQLSKSHLISQNQSIWFNKVNNAIMNSQRLIAKYKYPLKKAQIN